MSDLVFRTAYDFSFGARGDIDFGDEPSSTIQSAKDECDINLIVANAERGMLSASMINQREPRYGDFSQIGDYQSALNQVMAAETMFAELPAEIRRRFDNDPAKLLEFVGDAENRAEAVKLGLVPSPEVKVDPVQDPAPSGAEPAKPA